MSHTPIHLFDDTALTPGQFGTVPFTPQEEEEIKQGTPAPVAPPLVQAPEAIPLSDLSGAATPIQPTPALAPAPKPPEIPEIPVPTTPSTTLGGLEAAISGIEGFDEEAQVAARTEVQTRQVNEINDRIRKHNIEALEAEEAALQRAGGTTESASIEASRVRRDFAIKGMYLTAESQAAQGNLTIAQAMAGRAVDAEFNNKKADLRGARADLIAAYDTFSDADKKRANTLLLQIDERDSFVESEREKRKEIEKAIVIGITQGLDSATAELARGADSLTEAQSIITEKIGAAAPDVRSQVVEVGGRKKLINLNTGETIQDLGVSDVPVVDITQPITDANGETLVYGTPEYIIARLRATSGSKTKPVASEREQLGKFANVVALTGGLLDSLDKTTTDPIVGYLKSLNPYDFDARAVNAQVTALVPSVARALYGEVGVLTDTDIERYLKTLPNIRSTEEQNKFIAMMTLSNAKRAYEQTLLNLANSNVNVSGFTDSYRALTNQLEGLEQELSVGSVQEAIDSEDEAVFDEVVGNRGGNYFSRLWDSIMGR